MSMLSRPLPGRYAWRCCVFHYGQENLEELDLLLETLKNEDLDASDVYEAAGFLVLRLL